MNSVPEIRKPRQLRSAAFTLVELLVVIAVIAILAGLLFVGLNGMGKAKAMAVARAELTQIVTAIEAYKAKYGFYPPSSPATAAPANPLYYELTGMQIVNPNANPSYRSLDGSYSIPQTTVHNGLKVDGIVNSSTSVQATDDKPAIESFLKDLKPAQIGTNSVAPNVRVLMCSVEDNAIWRYNSTNPTNNTKSFDLWVNLNIGGKPVVVGNWNANP